VLGQPSYLVFPTSFYFDLIGDIITSIANSVGFDVYSLFFGTYEIQAKQQKELKDFQSSSNSFLSLLDPPSTLVVISPKGLLYKYLPPDVVALIVNVIAESVATSTIAQSVDNHQLLHPLENQKKEERSKLATAVRLLFLAGLPERGFALAQAGVLGRNMLVVGSGGKNGDEKDGFKFKDDFGGDGDDVDMKRGSSDLAVSMEERERDEMVSIFRTFLLRANERPSISPTSGSAMSPVQFRYEVKAVVRCVEALRFFQNGMFGLAVDAFDDSNLIPRTENDATRHLQYWGFLFCFDFLYINKYRLHCDCVRNNFSGIVQLYMTCLQRLNKQLTRERLKWINTLGVISSGSPNSPYFNEQHFSSTNMEDLQKRIQEADKKIKELNRRAKVVVDFVGFLQIKDIGRVHAELIQMMMSM
jgi:hypothetical protein